MPTRPQGQGQRQQQQSKRQRRQHLMPTRLVKRIWFWNYVHWGVCESLYEAFHRDPPLMEGLMINKTNQIIIISYLSGPPCCTRHCILISSLP